LISIGYLTYAACYAALAVIPMQSSLAIVYAVFVFMGLFMAATEGVEKALVADLAPEHQRGTAFGWFNLTAGAMLLPASFIFGELYHHFSATVAFGFSCSCALLAAVQLRRFHRSSQGAFS